MLIGAFTLAGISGIQISVFASRSKSWDFYKCGHKNLTNYRDQHHAANCKKSCDYLGISAIICTAADVWTLEQIILVFYIPSFQACVSKQGQGLIYSGLISGMHSSVLKQNYPARRLARYFCLSEQVQNIPVHVFQLRWKSRSFLCVNAPIILCSGKNFVAFRTWEHSHFSWFNYNHQVLKVLGKSVGLCKTTTRKDQLYIS